MELILEEAGQAILALLSGIAVIGMVLWLLEGASAF